jgi:hypothetical protein
VPVDGLLGQQQAVVDGAECRIGSDGQVGVDAYLTSGAARCQDVENCLAPLFEQGLSVQFTEGPVLGGGECDLRDRAGRLEVDQREGQAAEMRRSPVRGAATSRAAFDR